MLHYQLEKQKDITDIPEPAQAASIPEDVQSIEELFLTGQHLEQYRHATYNPMDYYLEALRRDPNDVRCNNAMGALLLRNGKIAESIPYFRTAIVRLTERNPNPYDGEPYYNLGLALQLSGELDAAYAAFYKSTWNAAWQDAGYFGLAQIDAKRAQWDAALEKIERSINRNWSHHKARQLKTSILRKLGRADDALGYLTESLALDPFNIGCQLERYLLTQEEADLSLVLNLAKLNIQSIVEYALDFAQAGLYEEAILLLEKTIGDPKAVNPMIYYALGYFNTCIEQNNQAKTYYNKASIVDPSYCFPNRVEEIIILQDAIRNNNDDAKAYYYLGNLWYGKRQHQDAVNCWEQSIKLDQQFPTVFRNLALAYYNRMDRREEAVVLLEKAFSLDETDARLLMELHQLYKKQGYSYTDRLALLDSYEALVISRDDLFLERITLFNLMGRYEEARQLLASRHFKPWEGGEGKVTRQYSICHLELAKEALKSDDLKRALFLLTAIDSYPHNLGEGRLITMEENNVDYYKGHLYRLLTDEAEARAYFIKATQGAQEPQLALFYNDPQPDMIFFQGLSWRELQQEEKATACFQRLIDHGKLYLDKPFKIDYFAVSLPDMDIWEDDLDRKNKIHCLYVMGLGYLGQGNLAYAKDFLKQVLELEPNHQACLSILRSFVEEVTLKN
jgi:tetratricopeptide (TPR) repeat protein